MKFFDLKICPFCRTKLEFRVVGDFKNLASGHCPSCRGTPMRCTKCGTEAIIETRVGVGCPRCGNNDAASCEIPYKSV